MDRRSFLSSIGSGAVATPAIAAAARHAMAGYLLPAPFLAIPQDKGYTPEALAALRARGQRRIYRGDQRFALGMPVGGICAGQLYLLGDGTLGGWHVDGRLNPTGYGSESYRTRPHARQLQQGFELTGLRVDRSLKPCRWSIDHSPAAVEFIGEYPVAEVRYRARGRNEASPIEADAGIEISLRAYSPFCPLSARDSAIPCTVLRFTVTNTWDRPAEGDLSIWLENGVERADDADLPVTRRNSVRREPGLTAVLMEAIPTPPRPDPRRDRPLADFESGTYQGWRAEGEAFADRPVPGTQPHQNPVSGHLGKWLVNSFAAAADTAGGDRPTGTLTSDPFTIDRDYITFLIGGGAHRARTCLNLLVDGKAVRTATGHNSEKLQPAAWDVSALAGQEARLQIVDAHPGAWGHVNVDQILLTDTIPDALRRPRPDSPSSGTMALAFLGDAPALAARGFEVARGRTTPLTFEGSREPPVAQIDAPLDLAPGASREFVFVVAWHFPNLHTGQGQMYTNWFADALDVARYIRDNDERLHARTELFRRTYYDDTTLPWWLALRLMMPTANLATGTSQWWRNGRFWGWEGVGCCHGTCTHVWNYSHAEARLFPELARSTRTMQDLGTAFEEATGRVAFRGEVDKGFAYAADGQAGTVLKCYREHLCSPDLSFLRANWPRIRKTLDYLHAHKDPEPGGAADGIIEGSQHNTYDIDFVGPNTFVGSLYLAALLAGSRMAALMDDNHAAALYLAAAEKGRAWTEHNLFNGKWFIQQLQAEQDTRWQYGSGCLADQLFGQTWAGLLDLGDVYDPEKVRAALRSIYRHNFAPPGGALGVYNAQWPAEREFAAPREGGVLTCTWPDGGRPGEPVRYRDEVWTGIEYQVATGLLLEGLVDEALTIIKAIDDRYDGALHNPWNEVECGDHYARAMAAWGAYQAVTGFVHDGPAGVIGVDPRIHPADFRAFFAAAEGWGLLGQTRDIRSQINRVDVRWGRLHLAAFAARLPDEAAAPAVTVTAAGRTAEAKADRDARGRWVATLSKAIVVEAPGEVAIDWRW